MDDNQNLLPASAGHPPDTSDESQSYDNGDLSVGSLLRYTAFGLLYRSAIRARRRVASVSGGIDRLSRLAVAPFRPLAESSMLQPLREQVDSLAARGQQELDRMIQDGQLGEQRSRQISEQVLNTVIGEVIGEISSNPQIQVLIQSQVELLAKESPSNPQLDVLVRKLAENYINYLNEHPEQVQSLIRNQGDVYINYLNANPESVQTLIAGQSLTLTAQIREEVNERMVTGDSLLEILARRLFRRQPREELPGPPPDVKARALQAFMESDLPRLQTGQNEPG